MKVFITGATGYIGGSVAKTLAAKGHEVFGLARDQNKFSDLQKLGITPVLGTLEDNELLTHYTQCSDAVINTANSDHKAAVETIIASLKNTGKTFIHSSGSSIVGDDVAGEIASDKIYSDDTPFTPMPLRQARVELNNQIRIAGIQGGMRTMVITPPMIYGDGLGLAIESDQIPKLIQKAKKENAGVYVGKGVNRWSNVHIEDLVNLYSLALEKGPSGAMFYAENGGEESFLTIAQAISQALDFDGKTMSISLDEAIQEFGAWARYAIASNSRIRANNARNLLGWTPKATSLLQWIKENVK